MPLINLSFQGWLNGVAIDEATDIHCNDIDVSMLSSEELTTKLKTGELFVSLKNCLDEANDSEVELFDFEKEED